MLAFGQIVVELDVVSSLRHYCLLFNLSS